MIARSRRAPAPTRIRPMRMRMPALMLVSASFLAGPVRAQLMEDPTLPPPRDGSEPAAEVGHLRVADPAIDAVMNFEFDRADSLFRARAASAPGSPGPEFGIALNLWWKLVSGREGVDPDDVESRLERAAAISRQYGRQRGRRAEALYYSGRAYSLLASLYIIEGSVVSGYRAGQRGRSYLEACLREDPDYHDAELGLGLYHYYADALPKFFKFIGWIFGVRGDRERGLAELRSAVEHGVDTRAEAAYFLTNVLTNFEGRPASGLGLVRWLTQAYPGNHIFFLEYQNALESLGYYPEAELTMRHALSPAGAFPDVRAVRLMLGRNLYRQGRYEEGAEVLETVTSGAFDRRDPAVPWFFYFAGRCRDLMGDRETAERYYRTAQSFKTGGNVSDLAGKRRENPESGTERRLRLARGMTRQDGRAEDAARQWTGILTDAGAGRAELEISIDQVRYRAALCLEEAARFDDAIAMYRSITDETLAARAAFGQARCRWRSGRRAPSLALLDSLASTPDFSGRAGARQLVRALSDGPCGADGSSANPGEGTAHETPAPEGRTRVFRYRDPEAFRVDLVLAGSPETCLPLEPRAGIWVVEAPIASLDARYYYRIDGSRREPDPLATWVRGEGGTVYSLVTPPDTLAERSEWYGLSER